MGLYNNTSQAVTASASVLLLRVIRSHSLAQSTAAQMRWSAMQGAKSKDE